MTWNEDDILYKQQLRNPSKNQITRVGKQQCGTHHKQWWNHHFTAMRNRTTSNCANLELPNFCVAYFPCCFLKTAIKISHSHFVHVAFVSILVFQTFDRMIFGTLTFYGARWYMMTVRDTQMVRDQKKFENHCSKDSYCSLESKKTSRHKIWWIVRLPWDDVIIQM